jgi:hypothetical protein
MTKEEHAEAMAQASTYLRDVQRRIQAATNDADRHWLEELYAEAETHLENLDYRGYR